MASHPAGTGTAGEYRVVAGDHLWSIASQVLARTLGHPPTTGEISAYWVELIETNRDRLRSGDPDLIYAGERLVLPPYRSV